MGLETPVIRPTEPASRIARRAASSLASPQTLMHCLLTPYDHTSPPAQPCKRRFDTCAYDSRLYTEASV